MSEKQSNGKGGVAAEVVDQLGFSKYLTSLHTLKLAYFSPQELCELTMARDWTSIQKPYAFISVCIAWFAFVATLVGQPVTGYDTKHTIQVWGFIVSFVAILHVFLSAPHWTDSQKLLTALYLCCYWLGTFLAILTLLPLLETVVGQSSRSWPKWANVLTPIFWWPALGFPFIAFTHAYPNCEDRLIPGIWWSFLLAAGAILGLENAWQHIFG